MYLGQFRHSLLRVKLETARASVTRNTTVVTNMSGLRSTLLSWSQFSFDFKLRSQLQTIGSNVTNHTIMVTSRNIFRFSLILRTRYRHWFFNMKFFNNSFTFAFPRKTSLFFITIPLKMRNIHFNICRLNESRFRFGFNNRLTLFLV